MHSSSTTQRKNKPPTSAVTKEETPPLLGTDDNNRPTSISPPLVAKVKRNKFGTSPFDENWLNLDCCGLVCATLTYCLHLYGVYVVCVILLPPWFTETIDGVKRMSTTGRLHTFAFSLIGFLAVFSHFKAMTTDPGAVPPDAEPLPDPCDTEPVDPATANGGSPPPDAPPPKPKRALNKRMCRRCNSFKPKRAHHCSICKRCIIKMDHHCPWVNNCVGIGNHKFFLLFVFYTCISCVYSFSLVVYRVVNVDRMFRLDSSSLLLIIGLVIESLLFGLFTSCMMCDQYDVVTTNVTNIDRLKGVAVGRDKDESKALTAINEVFGGFGFRLHWISPFCAATFPTSVRDEIMGYRRPERSIVAGSTIEIL